MWGSDNQLRLPRARGHRATAGYRGRALRRQLVRRPDSQASPRPSSPAPNHSTSVMAFGVKWNRLRASAAGLRGARTNRPRPHPRRARALSRAPNGPPARVEGRHAAPGVSILLLSTLVRTGRGRARAVSHFPCQSKTHTHTHLHPRSQTQTHTLTGHRPRAQRRLARVRDGPAPGRQAKTPTTPASGPQGRDLLRTHTPSRRPPHPSSQL